MWRWHPLTRWLSMTALWYTWYGLIGPLILVHHPWAQIDVVRPWFLVQVHSLAPLALFWAGAVWGILQDALMGLPIGFMGLLWATEAIILLGLKNILNFQSLSGLSIAVLILEAFQVGFSFVIAAVFSLAWKAYWDWWVLDSLVNIAIVTLFIRWRERSSLEYALRTHGSL